MSVLLPEAVACAFQALADAQREEPETAMVSAQRVLGGGVLTSCIEHVGDLVHRMNEHLYPRQWNIDAGLLDCYPKVQLALRALRSRYGFEREHEDNLRANAAYRGISLDEHRMRCDAALETYVRAHRRLQTYNRAQGFAKAAAMSLGHGNFYLARQCLERLEAKMGDESTWVPFAWAFVLDPNAHQPIPFRLEDVNCP